MKDRTASRLGDLFQILGAAAAGAGIVGLAWWAWA